MKVLKALVAVLPLLSVSCASIHEGKMATSVNNQFNNGGVAMPVKVSGKRVKLDGLPTFDLIEITMENDSLEWFKITRTDVLIDDPGKSGLSVVVGKDLEDWATAVKAKVDLENHNKAVVQSSLLAAAAVASAASDNRNTAIAAAGVYGATAGWVLGDVFNTSFTNAIQSKKVPSNHFLTPISIPAKLFVRRWLLLNVPPNAAVGKLVVELETADGKKANYAIKP